MRTVSAFYFQQPSNSLIIGKKFRTSLMPTVDILKSLFQSRGMTSQSDISLLLWEKLDSNGNFSFSCVQFSIFSKHLSNTTDLLVNVPIRTIPIIVVFSSWERTLQTEIRQEGNFTLLRFLEVQYDHHNIMLTGVHLTFRSREKMLQFCELPYLFELIKPCFLSGYEYCLTGLEGLAHLT